MGQILKPCPFCGDTTAVFLVGFHVKCDKCSALGPYDGVSRLAIAAWNTRAPDADHLEAIDAKDEQIRQLREALRLCEHKIDQHLQGQYSDGKALGAALIAARKALLEAK